MEPESRDGVDVERGYDAWAPSYDAMENPTRDLDAAALRAELSAIPATEVLEIGCGTGKNTGWLCERFEQVTAVDFSAGMLDIARRKHEASGAAFVRHDIREPWPFDEDRYDLVTCNLILEHIEDLGAIYREAARVLRPNGRLFLCELHPFRQLTGGQAQFRSEDGKSVPLRVFLHSIAEFLNDALAAGLTLERVGEWRGKGDQSPRLLSLLFRR